MEEMLFGNVNMIQLQLNQPAGNIRVSWMGGSAWLEKGRSISCDYRITYRTPAVIIQPIADERGLVELAFSEPVSGTVMMMNVGRRQNDVVGSTQLREVLRLTVQPDRLSSGSASEVMRNCLAESGELRRELDESRAAVTELERQIVSGSIDDESLRELRCKHHDLTERSEAAEREIRELTTMNSVLEEGAGRLQTEIDGMKKRIERCAAARDVIGAGGRHFSKHCEEFNNAKNDAEAAVKRMEKAQAAITGLLDENYKEYRDAVVGNGMITLTKDREGDGENGTDDTRAEQGAGHTQTASA